MNPSIINGIYAITPDWMDTDLLIKKTEEVLTAGVNVVQYRNKIATNDQKLSQAKEINLSDSAVHSCTIENDDVRPIELEPLLKETRERAVPNGKTPR